MHIEAMLNEASELQTPFDPENLSAWQFLGHNAQFFNSSRRSVKAANFTSLVGIFSIFDKYNPVGFF
jgi:hypothetical protein